ncbi:hypothetical protein [Gordonia hirsuta]|nr:hypothetical protein [Gordonia hirsuta]
MSKNGPVRQILGFALVGAFTALLATALTQAGSSQQVMVFSTLSSGPADTVDPFVVAPLTGLLIGAVIGTAALAAGFTMTGPAGNRMVPTISAGLLAAAVGPAIAVGVAFGGLSADPGVAGILAIYAACGLLSYGLSLGAVYVVLRAVHDSLARRTVVVLAWLLPIGALVAVAAGVGVASLYDFSHDEATWIATIAVAAACVALALALGRALALRHRSSSALPSSDLDS